MKPRILLRLINRESNASLLQNMPHIPWLDLAIVFCLCLKEDDSGLMTASIYNDHLDAWGISQNDLWLLAMENTPRHFPPVITHMSCILGGIEPDGPGPMRKQDDALLSSPLYVLTNSSGIHGAACILYPQVLKKLRGGRGEGSDDSPLQHPRSSSAPHREGHLLSGDEPSCGVCQSNRGPQSGPSFQSRSICIPGKRTPFF